MGLRALVVNKLHWVTHPTLFDRIEQVSCLSFTFDLNARDAQNKLNELLPGGSATLPSAHPDPTNLKSPIMAARPPGKNNRRNSY